jgi:hypothetical protein
MTLKNYRFYWKVLNSLRIARFKIKKLYFKLKNFTDDSKSTYLYLREIQKLIPFHIIFAFIFALLLQSSNLLLEPYKDYFETFNNSGFKNDYVTFLASVGAIGGVFIGLYYAALMSVQSALYSRLPNNIRDLLAQEKYGNTYMEFLSFLTFLVFILIVFRLYGFDIPYIAPFVILIFSGIGIFAFIKLGQQAFYFFDPTNLSDYVFKDIVKSLNKIVAKGQYAREENFQNYFYKQAVKQIDTLGLLFDFALQEKHLADSSLYGLNKKVLSFLRLYLLLKKQMITKNFFFEQSYHHRALYKTNNMNIYMQTGSLPEAETVKNPNWIEDRLLPYIYQSIELSLKSDYQTSTTNILTQLDAYLQDLVTDFEVEKALDIYSKIEKILFKHLDESNKKEKTLFHIGLVDLLGLMKVNILLKFIECLNSKNLVEDDRLKNINWLKNQSIYLQDFETYLLEDLEYLYDCLNYERRIEGKIITSFWYQNDLLKRTKTKKVNSAIRRLFSKEMYETSFLSEKHLEKAAFLSRVWEYLNKTAYHFPSIQAQSEKLKNSRKVDFKWDEIELKAIEENFSAYKKDTVQQMALLCIPLSQTEWDEGVPDYFGQFNTTIGSEIFDFAYKQDMEALKVLFAVYFSNAFSVFGKLKPTEAIAEPDQIVFIENQMKVAAVPILELLSLSGYLKLISEFYGDGTWGIVENAWNKYFEVLDAKVEFFEALVKTAESGFSLLPRFEVRQNQKKDIEDFFRRNIEVKKFTKKNRRPHGLFHAQFVAVHKSPLVRIFTPKERYHDTFVDGIDVFIYCYFREKFKDQKLDFGYRRSRDVGDMIDRENELYEAYLRSVGEN